jgi:SET domain-containing protein
VYTVSVRVDKSEIDGKGVFSNEMIPAGATVWLFKDGHDIKLSQSDYHKLPDLKKKSIENTGYLSPWSGYWVFPPDNDPAQYTNHSKQNNLTVIFDKTFSSEPYFVSNRDIEIGEELTNNYYEFDEITQRLKPSWAK